MKKYITMAALVMATAFVAQSCKEKNYDSYPPTWKGFAFYRDGVQVTTNNIFGGDKLMVRALQDRKGHLINSTYYNWDFTYTLDSLGTDGLHYFPEHTVSKQFKTNYDGISNADPEWEFQIPDNATGNAVIKFEAKYNYSGAGIQVSNGGDYGHESGATGIITPQSGSISGGAKGSVRIIIKPKV